MPGGYTLTPFHYIHMKSGVKVCFIARRPYTCSILSNGIPVSPSPRFAPPTYATRNPENLSNISCNRLDDVNSPSPDALSLDDLELVEVLVCK